MTLTQGRGPVKGLEGTPVGRGLVPRYLSFGFQGRLELARV